MSRNNESRRLKYSPQKQKRGPIYEIIDTLFSAETKMFSPECLHQCKIYPNEPQLLTT